MVFGLALVMALVLGVASMALGANGQAWILGQNNVAMVAQDADKGASRPVFTTHGTSEWSPFEFPNSFGRGFCELRLQDPA